MLPDALLASCRGKGIGILGSGDALHDGWLRLWRDRLREDIRDGPLPDQAVAEIPSDQ